GDDTCLFDVSEPLTDGSPDSRSGARLPTFLSDHSMPHLSFPFDLNGMFVDVMIAPGADVLASLRRAGEPLPMPRWGRAMIDTGTNVSGVSLGILEGLGIPSIDEVKTRGIGGELDVEYYE